MTFRTTLASRWLTVLLVVLAGWLAYRGARILVSVHGTGQEFARISERTEEYERDISRLRMHLERTDDPAWLEYQARLRLNYRQPDEKVMVVYKKENSGTISPVASPSVPAEPTFWERLKNWFGGDSRD
ncbi:MAG TPA: hypothetical protein VD862_00520 [Candidatus Paceibacterota bacterium]|nr:hypothetical protein [Candidatus Paceibacterota bacterium]